MKLRIKPTAIDRWVAAKVEQHASPSLERPAKILTYAGDEKFLLVCGTLAWLLSRRSGNEVRGEADHLALSFAVTVVLPHFMKRFVDQKRPDRRVHGPRKGIPISGREWDAFPSGHAMHVGAIASGLTRYLPQYRACIWIGAAAVSASRIILLAHWLSDVAIGLGAGVAVEHIIHGLENFDRT